MQRDDLQRRISDMEKAEAYYSQKYDRILKEYGSGVRPSWVSADLAEAHSDIMRCRSEVARLQAEAGLVA